MLLDAIKATQVKKALFQEEKLLVLITEFGLRVTFLSGYPDKTLQKVFKSDTTEEC